MIGALLMVQSRNLPGDSEGKTFEQDISRRISSSGIWHRVVRWVSTDVWEEHIVSIFDPEDGGDMFLRNVVWNSTDYTALYPIRDTLHNHSCGNLKSYKIFPDCQSELSLLSNLLSDMVELLQNGITPFSCLRLMLTNQLTNQTTNSMQENLHEKLIVSQAINKLSLLLRCYERVWLGQQKHWTRFFNFDSNMFANSVNGKKRVERLLCESPP
jgi:hypothetical protein